MRFFDNRLSLLFLLFSLLLLFLPKINLLNVAGETAGLRVDDFILLGIGTILVYAHGLSHQKIYKIEAWILLFTCFSFFSFFSNHLLFSMDVIHLEAKIFYTIRLLEYFLFFYIGAIACDYFRISSIVRFFFLWNLLWMVLQKFNLAGALTVTGYQTDVSTRIQGIASFPSEMGLLLNLIFCHMIYDKSSRLPTIQFFPPAFQPFFHRCYLYAMFGIFGILVVFTGNRISIVALFVCFIPRLLKEFSFRSPSVWILGIICIPLLLLTGGNILKKTVSVYERSSELFSYKNIELIETVWDRIDTVQNPLGNEVTAAHEYDMSWWMRIHKWIFVLKNYLSHPEMYLQGLGPGIAWSALDGGWLRILVEYGIIGFFLFWKILSCIYRINLQCKWMIVAFALNMIFFDAYLAYKTMSLLFFLSGYAFEKKQRMIESNSKNLNKVKCIPAF